MFSPSQLVAAFSLLLLTPAAFANDSLKNPSFESGDVGWSLFLPAEFVGTEAVKWEVIQQSEESHEGQSAAVLTGTDPIRWGISATTIRVSEGEKYRISAWVRFDQDAQILDKGKVHAYLRATMLDSSGQDVDGNFFGHFHIGLSGDVAGNVKVDLLRVSELPTEWRQIEGLIQIPPGVSKLNLTIFINGVIGKVYWDDVSIEKVPDETPLSRILE